MAILRNSEARMHNAVDQKLYYKLNIRHQSQAKERSEFSRQESTRSVVANDCR
jgi:hypothetical protein